MLSKHFEEDIFSLVPHIRCSLGVLVILIESALLAG